MVHSLSKRPFSKAMLTFFHNSKKSRTLIQSKNMSRVEDMHLIFCFNLLHVRLVLFNLLFILLRFVTKPLVLFKQMNKQTNIIYYTMALWCPMFVRPPNDASCTICEIWEALQLLSKTPSYKISLKLQSFVLRASEYICRIGTKRKQTSLLFWQEFQNFPDQIFFGHKYFWYTYTW